jgi:hypothetical protein
VDHLAEAYAKVHHYKAITGSGTLWSHLNCHLQESVTGCQKKNIQPRGKEGEEAIARFTGLPLQQHQAKGQTPFSQEAFHDTLVQFTVATDQMSFYYY